MGLGFTFSKEPRVLIGIKENKPHKNTRLIILRNCLIYILSEV
jgi:hypothetical protein